MASTLSDTRTGERSAIPWDAIEREWKDREYGAARRAVATLDGLALDDIDRLVFATDPLSEASLRSFEEDARRVLTKAFAAAASAPDGELLFALYLYGRCLEKWEKTEDYTRVSAVLRALGQVTSEGVAKREPAEVRARLLATLVSQAQLLDKAMDVEDALSCSCPAAMGKRARRVVAGLDALPEKEQVLDEELAELRSIMHSDAATNRRYFETIEKVAEAMRAFIKLDHRGRTAFDFRSVVEELEAAEQDESIKGDVYESELRAHRASLEALRKRADEPYLQIDAAELVYLYPFALEGRNGREIDPEETVARALEGKGMEALHRKGFRPKKARELELNDLWDRRDVSELGHSYSGATIELSPITVRTTAGKPLEFQAEVRLSRLGNHVVRVWSRLCDASLHDVNQGLRRGSHGMGKEKLTSDGVTWAKFANYADDVIKALGTERVRDLNSTFHVVLAARSISVQRSHGNIPATVDQLRTTVGASLLFHPVRHLATALEEWIRYPNPIVDNLLEQQGFADDLVARTDNTTVTYMPASAEWLVDEYQEMIEFVASIPPLLTLWQNRVQHLTHRVDTVLAALEHGPPMLTNSEIDELYQQELEMRRLESDVRGLLAFLASPALCRTRGQRQFLDRLWQSAGLPALEQELEQRLTMLAMRQERIAALALSSDQRHRQRLERPVAIVLAILGVASLASVLDWGNGAHALGGSTWAWGETSILVAAWLVVCLLYVRSWRKTRRTRTFAGANGAGR